jgi:diguanylate cyclase (GGDEF)-like protein
MLTSFYGFLRQRWADRIPAEIKHRVHVAQLTARARLGIMMAVVGLVVLSAVSWAFDNRLSDPALAASFAATGLMYCLLIFASIAWLREPSKSRVYQSKMRRFQIVQALLGSAWAAVMIAGINAGDANQRSLIYALAIALISTTMVSGPARYALSFWLPTTVGSYIAFIHDQTHFYAPILAALGCYTVLSFYSIISINRKLVEREVGIFEIEKSNETIKLIFNDFQEGSGSFLWGMDAVFIVSGFENHLDMALLSKTASEPLSAEQLRRFICKPTNGHGRVALRATIEKISHQLNLNLPFKDVVLQVHARSGSEWWSISGKPLFGPAGVFTGYRGIATDITEKEEYRQKIEFNANRDHLTKLFNRSAYQRIIDEIVAAPSKQPSALLCIDLDHFKQVNDRFGHAVGDSLLVAATQRIAGCIRGQDYACRLGGDEFVVILPMSSRERAVAVGSRIVDRLAAPFQIENHSIKIGACIGIAILPNDGVEPGILHRRADLALYRAKSEGRGTCRAYVAAVDDQVNVNQVMLHDLGLALDQQQFGIAYQPIMRLADQRVIGAEALLRWNHPQFGAVGPSDFVPLLEQSGQIATVGAWVIERVMETARQVPDAMRIAFNLSPVQLMDTQLPRRLQIVAQRAGIDPQRLELEVTESSVLDRDIRRLDVLREIRAIGFRIAVDDFGTGYSSLRLLDEFQFDKLKIDGSFIRDGATNERRLVILQSIIALGKSLGLTICAEGIETIEQAQQLLDLGCCEGQGFLFKSPMDSDKFLSEFGFKTVFNTKSVARQIGCTPFG